MKTIDDARLSYLVTKLLARDSAATAALKAHIADQTNPHGVKVTQLSDLSGGSLLSLTYPVGAIYLSTSATSPASLFGGSWERIQGRFLLAAGGGYAAGATGGEASHTLTVSEMPSHNHSFTYGYHVSSDPTFSQRTAVRFDCNEQTTQGSVDTSTVWPTGGSAAHNNMPPYLAVYAWKRVA